MINEWLMYRIWVSKETQPYVVEKIVKNVPKFPFSFNRYYDLPNERDHIQFRFKKDNEEEAYDYLVATELDGYDRQLYEWETNNNTINTALTATACAMVFMAFMGTVTRNNPMVMGEFQHFFLDAIGLDTKEEALLHYSCFSFLKGREEFKKLWEK